MELRKKVGDLSCSPRGALPDSSPRGALQDRSPTLVLNSIVSTSKITRTCRELMTLAGWWTALRVTTSGQ
eukprot:1562276-Prymnesium_polylepis.1